jgi:dephospho-CoA kinase
VIVLGLTGSIAMGKTTTARLFEEAGVPVHDSDATVHSLYQGRAAPLIEAAFPGTVTGGVVDRKALGARVLGDRDALARLEAIIHPLVRAEADAFLEKHRRAGTSLVVLDIPLLFETGGEDRVDRVAVVSAPPDVQRARVLARPGMTVEAFENILKRQMPDAEKRARADYVIDTGHGVEAARAQVEAIVRELSGKDPEGTP